MAQGSSFPHAVVPSIHIWHRRKVKFMIFFIYTGGCQKKGAPHQKRFTWIIMAMNKENVDKSYVFVLL